jgi:hypothetical protein
METWKDLNEQLDLGWIWKKINELLKKVVLWAKWFAGQSDLLAAEPKATIGIMDNNGNMPDWFKRFEVNSQWKQIGSFFTLEKGGKVDFITNENIDLKKYLSPNTINFWGIYNYYKQWRKNVALTVAGSFTPDWKIVKGIAYENGIKRGQDKKCEWSGLLVIKNGIPEIMNLEDILNFNNFKNEVEQKKWSMFQQIQVIKNWTKQNTGALDGKVKEFRFFVERETQPDKSKPKEISRWIVNFSKSMTLEEAVKILKDIGVKNALYLDTGNLSMSYFYDKNYAKNREDKYRHWMRDEKDAFSSTGYTNLVIFYSQ